MAYNLYQVQMAKAWAERIEKENAQAEKFWHEQALKQGQTPLTPGLTPVPVIDTHYYSDLPDLHEVRSVAGTAARSAAPTGYSSKTSYLRNRMEKLEAELNAERESRKKVEEDLHHLRASQKR